MKTFDIRIGVDNLNLKVKFSCKISISLKYRAKQYSVVEEQPLINGNFTSIPKEITNLEADYNQKDDKFADNQSLSIILYLHSSHGKLLVGSFLYKLNEIRLRKSITEKIKNSPDKNAEIKFTLELIKIKNRKETAGSNDEEIISKYSPQPHRQMRVTSLRSFVSQELPINSPNPRKQTDFQNLLKSLTGPSNVNLLSGKISKVQQKPGLPIPKMLLKSTVNSPEVSPRPHNLADSNVAKLASSKAQNRNSVELLKKKLSEVKQTTVEGNQKYLQRIAELQKELKQSRQKISGLELDIKLKQSNSKYFQKDLSSKKEKVESMEQQIKELNKKIITYEQRMRELQYNLKHLTEEHTEVLHANEVLTKKAEKRQEYYRELVDNLNQKYYEIQRQKQNVYYKVSSLEAQIEENGKVFNNELKEKEKRYLEEKNGLIKKISLLEKSLEEKKAQSINLAEKLKVSQKQVQQIKVQQQKMSNQNTKLKNMIEQLTLSVSKQEMQKKALEEELNEERLISHQNKILKEELESKNEEIELNTKKIGKMQEEIAENQQKIKELTTNLQNLEQQYEKLYYENIGQNEQIERKKKMVAQLMQQNESMEKNLEKINFTLKNQTNEFEEQRAQLQQGYRNLKIQNDKNSLALKQTKNQLMQETERRRICERQLLDSKKRIDDLENQVQNLQSRISNQAQELNKLKGSNLILTSRNQNLVSQIEQIKKLKDEKESRLNRLSEQNQQIARERQQKVEALEDEIQNLNNEIANLNKHNQELNNVIDSKKDQINDLRQQLSLKRAQQRSLNETKIDLQKNVAQHQQKLIELHEKIEKLQQEIAQYIDQNKQLDQLFNHQPTGAVSAENQQLPVNHEVRKKKINDLHNDLIKKDKQIQQYKANISNLELQITHLRDQQRHLREEINAKNEELSKVNQSEDQLKNYFNQNLAGLKDQLNQKQTEILAVSIFKLQNDMRIDEHQNTITNYKSLMEDLTNRVSVVLEEKNKLIQQISQHQKTQFKLNNEITKYKMNQEQFIEEQNELKAKINEMSKEIQNLNDEKTELNNKINNLSLKSIQLQHTVKEHQQTISHLNEKNNMNQKIIEEQSSEHQKQQQLIQKLEEQSAEKNKDINKKMEAIKLELSEKAKQLSQVQTEKKNRVQILSNNLDQLKKENFDLQSVAYAQKSNNTKLNSILSELTSSIAKIEKSNNIKTYYMIPIKDLLKKFEQIMEASDKMYAQFEKKNAKKQEKEKEKAGHGTRSSSEDFRFAEI